MQRLQHDLGVARTAEPHALLLKLPAEFAIVVDLAVVDENAAAILGEHGLGGGFGEIDDRQPAMSKGYAPLPPGTSSVGTTMQDRGKHCIDRLEVRLTTVMTPYTDQSTHERYRFPTRSPTR